MAGDDEQRQPLLGNESQGDYGASTSGGAPPAAEGESREAMEAREIAYACKTGPGGLSSAEAAERLERYGPNVLEEPQRNELLVFLGFFWGPMPFMIWIATIVVGIERDWEDVTVLLVLQLVNGTVGYFEERSAGDAISALKKSLAPKASVKRDGRFTTIEAKDLVPGDRINLKLGDIVPADSKLGPGKPLEVDQAALTGESLPVTRSADDTVFMGSIVRRGELEAIVCFTGGRTFFGRAAEMVNRAAGEQQGRFQRVMFQNMLVLLSLSIVLCTVIYIKLFESGLTAFDALSTTIVILIACIPIAMQVVSTTVMAVGGRDLAEKKAILARLSAIEELAGMDVLCSDKTGTLTQNKLELFDPVVVDASLTPNELVFLAALAAKRMSEGADAIDTVVTNAVSNDDKQRFDDYDELDFEPFDPVTKRTVARLAGPNGKEVRIAKGATKVILDMCRDKDKVRAQVLRANQDLADRGFRSIGVCRDVGKGYVFAGVLALFDPPRHDTRDTLEKARAMGVSVKMVTGDQTAIAVETSKAIALAEKPVILDMKEFQKAEAQSEAAATNMCERVDGFAEVYPEHKYRIVELLQGARHTVGMTGDGVNDAPALKKAQIGIAVEGSTDAARAAADIVLTEPGLGVIIDAILTARCIFARVRNYVIYRIACTLQLVGFFFLASLIFAPEDYYCYMDDERKIVGSYFASCDYTNPDSGTLLADVGDCHDSEGASCVYPYFYHPAQFAFALPVLGIVIITILNDGCMLTIARDHVIPAETPQDWNLPELRLVAVVLGCVPLGSSLLLLWLGLKCADGLYPSWAFLFNRKVPSDYQNEAGDRYYLKYEELLMLMYLKVSISDFLTLFCARCRGPFFSRAPAVPLFCAFLVATGSATLIAMFGTVSDKTYPMYAISKQACLVVWVYNLAFFLVQDAVKVGCYKLMSLPCCEAFLSCIGARDDPVEEDEKKRHLLEENAA